MIGLFFYVKISLTIIVSEKRYTINEFLKDDNNKIFKFQLRSRHLQIVKNMQRTNWKQCQLKTCLLRPNINKYVDIYASI